MRVTPRVAVLGALAACAGKTGTISVSLVTAPGSTVLDPVQTLRMTVTDPQQVLTAQRTSSGFDIALDLPATGNPTRLLVDGLDGSGTVIASGASPPFPVGAIDAALVIYMAAPNGVAAAPVALPAARSELAAGPLPYGVILAGGRDAAGAAVGEVLVYNAFTHAFTTGVSLPAPRSGLALATGTVGLVYLFGGRDAANAETATEWRFDTTVAPSGAYVDYGDKAGFARADQLLVPIGNEHFLLTGAPIAELSGLDGSLVMRDGAPLPAAGATVTATDGVVTAIFAGDGGVTKFRTGAFTPLPIAEATRAGASVVAIPGGKVAVLCGTSDAVRIDAASGTADVR